MRLSDCGHKVAESILFALKNKRIVLPTEVSLKFLEESSGCRVQSIGMSFNSYILPVLKENGVNVRKCGTPVVSPIQKQGLTTSYTGLIRDR